MKRFDIKQAMLAMTLALMVSGTMAACAKSTDQAAAPQTDELAQAEAVTELQLTDTKVGDGKEAVAGKTVTVHYTGTLYPSGEKFDSSLDRGKPFSFRLGEGQVIQGWDKGFAGMHVGGKRTLVIPYTMAYGESGYPPVIPPKSTLKFEVELLDVK